MTVAYFDSSALVKLVIEEEGSEDAALLWDGTDSVLTSRVAHPEVRTALAAAHRASRLDTTEMRRAKVDWDELRKPRDWPRCHVNCDGTRSGHTRVHVVRQGVGQPGRRG